MTSDLTIYAKWLNSDNWISELNLTTLLGSSINQSIDLPTSYGIYSITYDSSKESVFDNTGVYNRPYIEETISIIVKLMNGDTEVDSIEYNPTVEGYKDLSTTFASSYIYREYPTVGDNFFETLDVINCAFATGNSDGSITGSRFFNNVTNYIIPKAHEQGCWVIMSIAPESAWTTFANPDNNLIDTFATNVVKAINTYGFDGVDIDWEVPDEGQYTWFTSLAEAVYEKVKENNPNHLVTAAIGGGMWQPPCYDLNNSQNYLDYINVMCYGMSSEYGYYHNALYKQYSFQDTTNKVGKTLSSCSVDESVTIFKDTYKVPKSKIVISGAFYGIKQSRTLTDEVWSDWSKVGSVFYTNIVANYLSNSDYIYVFDDVAKVPYLIKNDYTEFISYENPLSLTYKCEYAINNNLAGIMYWENGCDTTGDLLNAIYDAFN